MHTTIQLIKEWYDRGVQEGAKWMIVVCDTFDHEDYPVFCKTKEEYVVKYDHYNGKNMQRIMEVYDLSKPFNKQAKGRVFNGPK